MPVFPRRPSVRMHRLIVAYSWNSQLLPQGDVFSGLLSGIDPLAHHGRRCYRCTGLRYDTMTTAVFM